MSVESVLRNTVDTVVFARNLNSIRADTETFRNATSFFDHRCTEDESESRLLDIRGPYVEMVQPPRPSSQTWLDFCAEQQIHEALRDAVTEVLFGGSEKGRLYHHQEQALRRGLAPEERGMILSVPTATGKTESFLLPILQHCLTTPAPHRGSPLRAIVVYPTKTLEADQLNRILRLVFAVNSKNSGARRLRIGIWDGDTPSAVSGSGASAGDQEDDVDTCPLRAGESVRGLECPHPDCRREGEPAKLLASLPESGWQLVCPTHPDRILEVSYARRALSNPNGAVDILLTTPEALDHALASPLSKLRPHLRRGRVRYVVYDEAHVWPGAGGTAIRQLTQRLLHEFRQREPGCKTVLASATVSDPGRLYHDLTGEDGEVIRFGPMTIDLPHVPLSIPSGWRPIEFRQLMDAIITPADDGDTIAALASLGLSSGGELSETGRELHELMNLGFSIGMSVDAVLAEDDAFRDAWRSVLLSAMPSIWRGLWQLDEDDVRVQMASWHTLCAKVAEALPHELLTQVDDCLNALLSYGRGAGLFVDRYHFFLVPPTGVFFSPETQLLHNSDHPAVDSDDHETRDTAPLPEVGICGCGQPYIALLQGHHNEWLDREPLRSVIPADHPLRLGMADEDQPGIYWPVGHQVMWRSNPYESKNLTPKRRGVVRQRCPVCMQLLSDAMLRSAIEEGFRFGRGYPRPARLNVETLVNYLLSSAIPHSKVGRVLAIADGRNLAGRIGRNFLRDDTKRLGVSGLFVHHILAHGPTPAHALHDEMRRYENGRPKGVVWDRLIHNVYGEPGPIYKSPLRQAVKDVVFDDAFLDRYRWIVLDFALLVPEALQATTDLDEFERLASWYLFAYSAIKRPKVTIKPIRDGGTEVEDEDEDEEPLYEEESATSGATHRRFVTRTYLKRHFIRHWTGPKIRHKTGHSEAQLDLAFDKLFDCLVDIGFFRDVAGETLNEWLMNAGLIDSDLVNWLEHHGLSVDAGRASGAFTYETRRGEWLVGVSRSRTFCEDCGKAWLGRFPLCWSCGNNDPDRMRWHDPQNTQDFSEDDRLGTFLPQIIKAANDGTPPPVRTVEALRAGLAPLDRSLIEDAFRKGHLNVLAATSLMELGVDIGRLDMLLQHGVPPTFTNYVQRSGRVGRSLGRPAWVFNVLRPSNPIDMYFFGDLENRFFRDLSPIWIPESHEAKSVAAAQIMSELLSRLAAGGEATEYKDHWRSPTAGRRDTIERAVTFVNSHVQSLRDELLDVLGRFGFDRTGAEDLLEQLLNASSATTDEPPIGSHIQRVTSLLARLALPGASPQTVTQAICQLGNYPMMLARVGMFGLYRNIGEPYVVRLRMPNDRMAIETRSADQLLRECFPGPGRGQSGGFFYRGMTMWRVNEMIGEETVESHVLQYCDHAPCELCGTAFSQSSTCPACEAPLARVRTAAPTDCEAQQVTGFLATDPRVMGMMTTVIASEDLPQNWESCGDLGELGWSDLAKLTLSVAMFYDGQAREYRPSRIHVPNPSYGGEYCAGIHQHVPVTTLRLPRSRFMQGGLLNTGSLWSCYAAFRQSIGVLLRRDVGDYTTIWDVDDDAVYLSVADSHTGGTGLARQWHQFLGENSDRLIDHLMTLSQCTHCSQYCHYCLLHERMSPRVVELLDRRLLPNGFGLMA